MVAVSSHAIGGVLLITGKYILITRFMSLG